LKGTDKLDLLDDFVISEKNMIIDLEADTYQEVIQKLGTLLFKEGFVKDSYVQAVLDREEIFPTGLQFKGGGIAIPHTDSEHVKRSTLGIATLSKDVDFHAMAEPDKIISVSIVMMLAVADKNKVVPVLTKIINILQNETAIAALKNATSKTEIKTVITNHI
jgi:PTS system galactitol-specific IIA component